MELIAVKAELKMNEQSEYLFQVEPASSKLFIFCILKKEMKTYELNCTFFNAMGFNHFESCFYHVEAILMAKSILNLE